MLSIGKLGSGQESYYLEKVAEGAEDYYSGEGEAEGYWVGSAAALLGLEGKVDGEQLTAMLTGLDPATGEPLGLRAVGGRGPVPGFDLTLDPLKLESFSAVPLRGSGCPSHERRPDFRSGDSARDGALTAKIPAKWEGHPVPLLATPGT
jgi:hypothetical protein